nr:hypothetical protein [uncultured Acetatifactor sp.]
MNRKYIGSALFAMMGGLIGGAVVWKAKKKDEENLKVKSNRNRELMLLLNQWLKIKQDNKQIIDYFHMKKIHAIAIYGMSYVGERLYEELKDSDIEISYGIDKKWSEIYADIDVISPEEELPETDAIIVTPIFFFDEIKDILSSKVKCPIISLEDILYEL